MEIRSSTQADGRPLLHASHQLVSVLPLLYIAWADGILTPSEIKEISARIEGLDWIDPADKETVRRWLDPTHPPSPTQYYRWIRTIRTTARHIPHAAELSLAELGIEMAHFAGADPDSPEAAPEALRALADIEVSLGIVGHEVARDLLEARPAPSPEAVVAPPFDVAAMTRLLDGAHAALRNKIRTLLRDARTGLVLIGDLEGSHILPVGQEDAGPLLRAEGGDGTSDLGHDVRSGDEDIRGEAEFAAVPTNGRPLDASCSRQDRPVHERPRVVCLGKEA